MKTLESMFTKLFEHVQRNVLNLETFKTFILSVETFTKQKTLGYFYGFQILNLLRF